MQTANHTYPPATVYPSTVIDQETSQAHGAYASDYPYGRLKCTMYYWVETADKGSAKGQQRGVHQSTNPKSAHRLNKPHHTTYHSMTILYREEEDPDIAAAGTAQSLTVGHLRFAYLDELYTTPIAFAEFARAFLRKLDADQTARLERILRASRGYNKDSWREWQVQQLDSLGEEGFRNHILFPLLHAN